jgi:protein phosphatase
MNLDIYALSNIGLKRTENQDNYYCDGVCPNIRNEGYRYKKIVSTENPSLFAVFDGMGGHVHGERASQIAVEETDKAFKIYQQGEAKQLLLSICASANNRICDEILHVVKGRMGSTAAMLLFENNQYHLCNLGDSPVFLIRDNCISTISYEHSERQNYEEIFGENYDRKKKFKLTQHLGIFPDEMEISPYYTYGNIREGDTFLLCSDGLTDMVSEQDILSVLANNNSLETATEQLLSLALDNGGKDNVTIIACKALKADIQRNKSYESIDERKTNHTDIGTKKKPGKTLAIILACIAVVVIAGILFFVNGKNPWDDEEKPQTSTSSEATEKATQTDNNATPDEAASSAILASELLNDSTMNLSEDANTTYEKFNEEQ